MTSAGTILKSGYNTTMAAGAGNVAVPAANMPATCPATTGTTYLAGSRPANPGSTGTRSFGTDQGGTIFQFVGDSAATQPLTGWGVPIQ